MNPPERLAKIKDVMESGVSDVVKVDRIDDILNADITISDLSAAQDKSYHLGYEDGKGRLFYPMIIWGAICGVAGYIIAFAVIP